jgi:hypothetical protein
VVVRLEQQESSGQVALGNAVISLCVKTVPSTKTDQVLAVYWSTLASVSAIANKRITLILHGEQRTHNCYDGRSNRDRNSRC